MNEYKIIRIDKEYETPKPPRGRRGRIKMEGTNGTISKYYRGKRLAEKKRREKEQ